MECPKCTVCSRARKCTVYFMASLHNACNSFPHQSRKDTVPGGVSAVLSIKSNLYAMDCLETGKKMCMLIYQARKFCADNTT